MRLLHAICTRASESNEAPFAALFEAYDNVFAEREIDQNRDGVVFRYLMRVGDTTRAANKARKPVDLVERLRSVLEALGITFVDHPGNEPEEETGTGEELRVSPRKPYKSPNRRVSFDDARLEETWLSEHSQPVNPPSPAALHGLLSLPPRRGRHNTSERRARSTSSQRSYLVRSEAPKYSQHASPPTAEPSEPDDQGNPTLLFETSQTQLEQNAEAFLSTSSIRCARQALQAWHNNALQLQQARSQAYSNAVAHDRRILKRQALDQWRAALAMRLQERRDERLLKRLSEKAQRAREAFLLHKAFTHWALLCEDEKLQAKVAQCHVLKVTYFKRWKAIASENQMKVRSILVRKHISVWRARTARRLLQEEQAEAHYEEALMKKCKTMWFWHFCSRRVEGWHEQWIERRTLSRLADSLQSRQEEERQAEQRYCSQIVRKTFKALTSRLQDHRDRLETAQQHHERAISTKVLSGVHLQTKMAPVARTLRVKIDDNLQRKALRVWHLSISVARQAAQVDRKRILQTAWTNWNDALRCKALAQRIDERVLVENVYRWVLQERLRLFQRTFNARLISRVLGWWRAKVEEDRDKLADAEVVFAERQRRRKLAYGMFQLNIEMRSREDAERVALEFGNSRALPKVLDTWREKSDHMKRLAKMAADGRFYSLCSPVLRTWKERTSEHKANRRRDAYAQIRARVKIQLVGRCFVKWRTACMEIHSMDGEALRRAEARVADIGTRAFARWREKSAEYADLNIQAVDMDQQKLLSSALNAVVVRQADFVTMDQQALDFRQETDLGLLAGALRRVQWATFTAARKLESADALWLRNRDQHIKQMLRHWAAQTAERRAAATQEEGQSEAPQDEPESPSLRPASRAASRSAGTGAADLGLPSSPPQMSTTPRYMRTPSRPRRAGRFRPLPTPVPFTPMAFDSALIATSPAPIPSVQSAEPQEQTYESLTPQVTPFSRKLRAGGFPSAVPPSAIRSTGLGRSVHGGTGKSVRFAGSSRFRGGNEGHVKNS